MRILWPTLNKGSYGESRPPIGLTMTLGERVMPNLFGVDIGCGMLMAKVKTKGLEFQKLDKVIRENIPSGFAIRQEQHSMAEEFELSRLNCPGHINEEKARRSLGTLGGGKHFIEIDKGDKDTYVDVSALNETEKMVELREEDCSVETMHSGGKGGQNVNKVETGVRIGYEP